MPVDNHLDQVRSKKGKRERSTDLARISAVMAREIADRPCIAVCQFLDPAVSIRDYGHQSIIRNRRSTLSARDNQFRLDTPASHLEVEVYEGKAMEAIEHARKALNLNPHPPGWYFWYLGFMEYAAGRYEDAVETLRREGIPSGSQRILAASLAQLGCVEAAKAEAGRFVTAYPDFSIQRWVDTQPFQRESDRQHFINGYLKAGLPM